MPVGFGQCGNGDERHGNKKMSSQLPPRPEFKQQSTKIAPPTRGLKIKNKDSDKRAEQRQVEESQKQHFEENADKTVSVYHEKHKRVLDLNCDII